MSQHEHAKSHHGHQHWPIVIALIGGIGAGVILQQFAHPAEGDVPGWVASILTFCRFVSDLFLRALKMVIVPLVVASIISGIAGLRSLDGFARMGLKTCVYYVLGSFAAVCVGLFMVNTIKPGISEGKPNSTLRAAMDSALNSKSASEVGDVMKKAEGGASSLLDILKRMIPTNVIEACAKGDLLAIIVFSILFAVAMVLVPGGSPETLREVFAQLADVMTLITTWVMKVTPLAVFCLVIPAIAEVGLGVLQNLVPYVLTVVGALLLHTLLVMPIVLKFSGVSPMKHFRNMSEALLMSFSTASSTATIPVTMRCIQDQAKVSERVSSFVIPLGATVNMNGTALYECVVVVFAAQVMGLDLSLAQQFIVVLLALVSSIGVAGIPAASLVAIIIIMQNAGFSEDMIKASLGLILTIDRPLDMARTTVNVFGDTVGAVVIAKSEGESLEAESIA
ncbi:dicarboxylate/amino acid:cation symporter [Prosthecobacter sp.]|uniref:dicarboxylate/amino acid:cation symporter n=1 Tax=Prosthecobacter sp. TaxID=1965333 RepID=UPI001D972A57|nr:dicarboxylate/amino acid:cation symporter [Prosthecobacter sp.]MCB1275425.1 dicarboxylate/amino acid:cation symporter [Prosthecobacter sp.]